MLKPALGCNRPAHVGTSAKQDWAVATQFDSDWPVVVEGPEFARGALGFVPADRL
ncbi:MAG TPA: hypothetical protein VJH69_00140 [Candidatus Paceibacterota bacterium]